MKNTKSWFLSLLSVLLLLALIATPALAQTPEPVFRLNLSRDWGYGAGADIKGLFSLKVVGPENLAVSSVTYYIDGEVMQTVTEDPFKFQFNTSQFTFGWHELTAEVTTTEGSTYTTPARRMNFVTSEMESESMKNMVGPMLLLILGVMIVVGLIQFATMRKNHPNGVTPGTQRNYGYAGGSICRHCGRPTPRHIWGFNIGIGKFDRCENCGKWSVMRAAPLEILRAAEIAEKESEKERLPVTEKTEEEKLRDLIEKSKFDQE